jgi:hypothetical protein
MTLDIKTIHSLPVTSAVFHHLGYDAYSAVKMQTLRSTWESDVLDGTENLISWVSYSFSLIKNSDKDRIYVYYKTADSPDMAGAEWQTPYMGVQGAIDSKARYLVIRIVLCSPVDNSLNYQGMTLGPTVSDMTISGIATDSAALFFTKTFELNFFPKSIVTTVMADIPDGTALDIGISSLDSIDVDDYQFVEPNKLTDLDQLAVTGTKFKLMLRMSGSGNSSVVVHEFGAMFSGDGQSRLNQ